MASTRSKFKLKQRLKEIKANKKNREKESADMEDSGVHLEDSSASCKSWDAEDLICDLHLNLSDQPSLLMDSKSEDDFLSRDLQARCHVTKNEVVKSTFVPPQITVTSSPRVSKSESPTTGSRLDGPFPTITLEGSHCTIDTNRGARSAPISPTLDQGDKVLFCVGPDNDEVDYNKDSEATASCRRSKPLDQIICKTSQIERKSSAGPLSSSNSKSRFKKILLPLKRSHSAGSKQDVPAHALFLRHELASRRMTPESKSSDNRLGSMDPQSSESDADEVVEKTTKGKNKSGKKSLARDVKEKFSFLRRRNTDSTLSGKDGKTQKPSTETVLNWSKQFDNLLQDKYGLELFRNYLQSEFSEENLEFWIACEDYKNLKSNKLSAQAQKIYSDFVAIQAPREINLSSKARETTAELAKNPDRHTFESAQRRIQALMETDSYPRFLQSPEYQELLGDQKINFKFNFT